MSTYHAPLTDIRFALHDVLQVGTSDIPGLTPQTWASVLAHDYETWNTPPFYIDTAQLSPDDAVCQIISHLHSI